MRRRAIHDDTSWRHREDSGSGRPWERPMRSPQPPSPDRGSRRSERSVRRCRPGREWLMGMWELVETLMPGSTKTAKRCFDRLLEPVDGRAECRKPTMDSRGGPIPSPQGGHRPPTDARHTGRTTTPSNPGPQCAAKAAPTSVTYVSRNRAPNRSPSCRAKSRAAASEPR